MIEWFERKALTMLPRAGVNQHLKIRMLVNLQIHGSSNFCQHLNKKMLTNILLEYIPAEALLAAVGGGCQERLLFGHIESYGHVFNHAVPGRVFFAIAAESASYRLAVNSLPPSKRDARRRSWAVSPLVYRRSSPARADARTLFSFRHRARARAVSRAGSITRVPGSASSNARSKTGNRVQARRAARGTTPPSHPA